MKSARASNETLGPSVELAKVELVQSGRKTLEHALTLERVLENLGEQGSQHILSIKTLNTRLSY